MALQILAVNSIGAGIRVNLGATDNVFVGKDATIGSTDNIAIDGTGSGHHAEIQGTVIAQFRAIELGSAISASNNSLFIGESGVVTSLDTNSSPVVYVYGNNAFIENRGTIHGFRQGIGFGGDSVSATTTLINSGVIEGKDYAITRHGSAKDDVIVNNSGLIAGATSYTGSGPGVDTINNTGTMKGSIYLVSGNDVYNGASGRLTGTVFGGAGNDTITGGIDNDWFAGGNDNDTLKGNGGNDTLFGDDGNDVLKGDAGNDKLNGGAGNDTLTGGANNDIFVFNTGLNKSTNVDRITDFNRPGDTIHLENAIFTKLTKVGVLNKDFFKLGTKATDANDHIIYNKATGALFYDPDGTGAAAQVQFATLANKPAIAFNDFVVI